MGLPANGFESVQHCPHVFSSGFWLTKQFSQKLGARPLLREQSKGAGGGVVPAWVDSGGGEVARPPAGDGGDDVIPSVVPAPPRGGEGGDSVPAKWEGGWRGGNGDTGSGSEGRAACQGSVCALLMEGLQVVSSR